MAESKSAAEKTVQTDETSAASRDSANTKSAGDTSSDVAKVLQQDLIKLTAQNFENALKELQKIAAARGKDPGVEPGQIAAHVKAGGRLDEAHVRGQALAAQFSFSQVDAAVPLAQAQLEKTVQNLATFLVTGSSEVAMRASICINEARQAVQSIIETTSSMQDQERTKLTSRTDMVVGEARRQKSLLPEFDPHEETDDGHLLVPHADYSRIRGIT